MSESIVQENPAFAHVSRPPSEDVWWTVRRRDGEWREGKLNVVAVLSRTWFTARAVAMVLLGTDEVDGERSGAPNDGAAVYDHNGVLFCDLGAFMSPNGPPPPFDRRAVMGGLRAGVVRGDIAYGPEYGLESEPLAPLPAEVPAAHAEDES